mmetsp:Transcript_19087/g.29013  ORF Transcript_19087/g.29013 Transcript_19087/m.29013 type:complete len:274 (+) Transcript_19087:51-872(+)|eukprot:CAMPEP_0118685766 /NCGR_PEP_ID=MMETSP0800-20121206/7434_1 /TAXON_ID=210618 ORGANISM="Striatella unipunctata, Strain CCMP2910" /NCGR_SAMPLE_ID=MMETSP0800 /ASSEMBLY_ACC=CAM_ASM_000638 /LENGTH=273 /DNA_ID=CAMNT_0006582725 /DNA_START=6 /DNA_END=827 /DNA_ORIENTATION=-
MTSGPSIKISYFGDNKGRNELARLILCVGGVEFESEDIGFKGYVDMRDSGYLPYGQLPILTLNKIQVFGQSCAIARYTAKRVGLYPQNDEIEALLSDGVVDSWRDVCDLYYETVFSRVVLGGKLMMVPHPTWKRHDLLKAFVNSELTQQLKRYERLLKPSGQICNSLPFPSWADLAIYDVVKTMEGAIGKQWLAQLLNDKPAVRDMVKKVDEIEAIQAHLKKHPYQDMTMFFVPASIPTRIAETLFFPLIRTFLGIFTMVRSYMTISVPIKIE